MWTKPTRIAGRIAIASDFSELKDFFLDVLEVGVPDKSTNIMELEALCQVEKTPSISQVKALLWEINSWEPSHSDLDPLRPLKAFPVLGLDRKPQLRCLQDIFVLYDRQSHVKTFKGKVGSLDFSLEDIRSLRPLINALGLSKRYSSTLIREDSHAEDVVLDPHLSKYIRDRAHAIFRYICLYLRTF